MPFINEAILCLEKVGITLYHRGKRGWDPQLEGVTNLRVKASFFPGRLIIGWRAASQLSECSQGTCFVSLARGRKRRVIACADEGFRQKYLNARRNTHTP